MNVVTNFIVPSSVIPADSKGPGLDLEVAHFLPPYVMMMK
jgi:hypothetical protein